MIERLNGLQLRLSCDWLAPSLPFRILLLVLPAIVLEFHPLLFRCVALAFQGLMVVPLFYQCVALAFQGLMVVLEYDPPIYQCLALAFQGLVFKMLDSITMW